MMFYLYNNDKLTDYLVVNVYLRKLTNQSYHFYNSTAHITFDIYKDNSKIREIRDYLYEPQVLYNNYLLTISEQKGDQLTITMKS